MPLINTLMMETKIRCEKSEKDYKPYDLSGKQLTNLMDNQVLVVKTLKRSFEVHAYSENLANEFHDKYMAMIESFKPEIQELGEYLSLQTNVIPTTTKISYFGIEWMYPLNVLGTVLQTQQSDSSLMEFCFSIRFLIRPMPDSKTTS